MMRLAVALLTVTITACASLGTSGGAGVNAFPVEEIDGGVERPPGSLLNALPESATYLWVLPSEMYRRTQPADSVAMLSADGMFLRESIETVLRGSGWREVPRGTQQFEVTAWVLRRRVPLKSPLATTLFSEREDVVLGIRRADRAGAYWRVPFTDIERTSNAVSEDLVRTLLRSRCGSSRCGALR
ncbi:MAG: hypothetical protein ACKVS7_08545 [Gemmatimonadaceae bacterium]